MSLHCPRCPRLFATSAELERHKATAHRIPRCPTCSKEFYDQDALNLHTCPNPSTLKEPTMPGLTCPDCARTDFGSNQALAVHRARTHGQRKTPAVNIARPRTEPAIRTQPASNRPALRIVGDGITLQITDDNLAGQILTLITQHLGATR